MKRRIKEDRRKQRSVLMRKGQKKGKKMREREKRVSIATTSTKEREGEKKKHTEAKATRGFDQALILYLYQRYFYISHFLSISRKC